MARADVSVPRGSDCPAG